MTVPAPGRTVVIGGGPAGLTSAYELSKLGLPAVVLEQSRDVGGLSRTVAYNGYRFDIGGHRFFTKIPTIQELWQEILDEDFLVRPRLSRIYYRGKFFDYPLKPLNALRGLGPVEAVRIGLSYVVAQLRPTREERSFEDWVSNRFGRRLFELFFKTYTEKVWGMPCSEISADWAAQRIKNLDLFKLLRQTLLGSQKDGEVITTLIDSFHYPRFGPGMMWQCCRDRLAARGVETFFDSRVVRIRHTGGRVAGVTVRDAEGRERDETGERFISSMPLRTCLESLDPPPPAEVLEAARSLRYRDFLTVVLIVGRDRVFPDNWIYIHSPEVLVGRVQNFKNWSPDMVPDPGRTSLGLEYFVNEGDPLWTASDEELLARGAAEMETLGLVRADEVEDGTVVRVRKAYPVYDGAYKEAIATIRGYLDGFSNFQTIGRNGQHRYNNQDHSMLTGIYAAQNIAGESHDIWSVNVEPDYHEERDARATPGRIADPTVEELLRSAFARFDPVALGVAVGSVAAAGIFLATAVLLVKGGDPIGPTLSLLGHYLLGYQVSWGGAVLGALEAALGGGLLGYLTARAINLLVGAYETSVRRRLQLARSIDPLEVGSEYD